MTAKEIVQLAEDSGVRRICLTGGEPLMHKELRTLVYYLNTKRLKVHIETSGTIPLGPLFINPHRIWITVSPKAGYLIGEIRQNANEVKLLVDENMTDEILTKFVAELFPNLPKGVPFRESPIVWLQPINNENSIRQDNVQRCLNFMKKHTWMRLSLQQHKAIGAR
jgi:organic radical activating enzyme